jgi:hypothetical protein
MAALPICSVARAQANAPLSRVRPDQPGWPSDAEWQELGRSVEVRLTRIHSSLDVCRSALSDTACRELFRELKNPYFIGDDPSVTQTTGWLDAWTAQPSAYVVAARRTADVVAAVNFARDRNLRLVVRGGGHSYLGTSNAPDSLMIWTRPMAGIGVHDAFIAHGCAGSELQPAVSVGAGAIWTHTYNAVTTEGGRFVQGGGCGTVGVAGLVQGGGFGSYSKNFGTAAASLLEAEIVTADGEVRIASACANSDLFWALKGGGGVGADGRWRVSFQELRIPAVARRRNADRRRPRQLERLRRRRDPLQERLPDGDRPGAPERNIYWAANVAEAGHFIEGFESQWLPASLLSPAQRDRLTSALLAAARHSTVELHFQKGLAGASEEAARTARDTATSPAMIDAFALAIVASEGPPAYPGLRGHEPDFGTARRNAAAVRQALAELRTLVPRPASYVAESGYLDAPWQDAYWGPN